MAPKNGTAVAENDAIGGLLHPSNDAETDILFSAPYTARVEITGTANLLFHRWSVEAVAEKGAAAKGSKAKKTDDLESYVWRTDDGQLALPGEYLRQAIIGAGRYKQDPRSPRKSAMDLLKAAVLATTELAGLGQAKWDLVDSRRVTVQRNGITRQRPCLLKGWTARFDLEVLLPEYVTPDYLAALLVDAGRLIGVGDFRPTFGRFRVSRFEVL